MKIKYTVIQLKDNISNLPFHLLSQLTFSIVIKLKFESDANFITCINCEKNGAIRLSQIKNYKYELYGTL